MCFNIQIQSMVSDPYGTRTQMLFDIAIKSGIAKQRDAAIPAVIGWIPGANGVRFRRTR